MLKPPIAPSTGIELTHDKRRGQRNVAMPQFDGFRIAARGDRYLRSRARYNELGVVAEL